MPGFSRMFSLLMLVLLGNIVGCATFHSPFEKKMPKATAANPVVEIVCLWQPGEGSDPDGVPCRGFSGQILFLARGSSTPVQIEGDVRVYLFDDQGTLEEQTKPLRQFDFDNGSWSVHLTDSSFGPTYQVFIPYVRRGVTNADCSLRVRLKPKQGPVVFSEFSNMPLNGQKKSSSDRDAKSNTNEEIDRMAAEAMTSELRQTTTISMGSNPKVVESGSIPSKVENPNQIQLVSHEQTVTPKEDSDDKERIRRLETMLQQLLEQKTNLEAKPEPTVPRRLSKEQTGLDEESDNSTGSVEGLKMSRRIKARLIDHQERRETLPRRQAHPLDDDQPTSVPDSTRRQQESGHDQDPSIDKQFDSPVDSSTRRSPQGQQYQWTAH